MERRLLLLLATLFAIGPPAVDAREWTDSTGKHTVEAAFVELKAGVVRLKKLDGSIIALPVTKLSKADREFAEKQAAVGAMSLRELVTKVDQSVVQIRAIRKGSAKDGTGFLIDKAGIVATNYHVIEGATGIKVACPDKSPAAFKGIVGLSPQRDIALLQVDYPTGKLEVLPLAAALPERGDQVAAFGSPLGLRSSVSEGIVGGIRTGNELRALDEQSRYSGNSIWIQTSAPISQGNSGGPLVNMAGLTVGMNTLFLSKGQNLNFAIAAIEIQQLLETSKGKPLRKLADLPKPRSTARGPLPVQPPPDVAARSPQREKERQAILKRLYEQRLVLLAQRESAVNRLTKINTKLTAANAEYAQLAKQALTVQQTGAAIQQKMGFVQTKFLMAGDDYRREQYRLEAASLQQQYNTWVQRYHELDAHARRVNVTVVVQRDSATLLGGFASA